MSMKTAFAILVVLLTICAEVDTAGAGTPTTTETQASFTRSATPSQPSPSASETPSFVTPTHSETKSVTRSPASTITPTISPSVTPSAPTPSPTSTTTLTYASTATEGKGNSSASKVATASRTPSLTRMTFSSSNSSRNFTKTLEGTSTHSTTSTESLAPSDTKNKTSTYGSKTVPITPSKPPTPTPVGPKTKTVSQLTPTPSALSTNTATGETTTPSDSLVPTPTKTAGTLTQTGTASRPPTPTLEPTPSLSLSRSHSVSSSFTSSASGTKSPYSATFSDQTASQSLGTASRTHSAVDTASKSHSLTKSRTSSTSQSVTRTPPPTASRSFSHSRSASPTSTVTATITPPPTASPSFSPTISPPPTVTKSFTITPPETPSLTDTVSITLEESFSDSLSLSDSLVDTVSGTESLTEGTVTLTETVDSLSISTTRPDVSVTSSHEFSPTLTLSVSQTRPRLYYVSAGPEGASTDPAINPAVTFNAVNGNESPLVLYEDSFRSPNPEDRQVRVKIAGGQFNVGLAVAERDKRTWVERNLPPSTPAPPSGSGDFASGSSSSVGGSSGSDSDSSSVIPVPLTPNPGGGWPNASHPDFFYNHIHLDTKYSPSIEARRWALWWTQSVSVTQYTATLTFIQDTDFRLLHGISEIVLFHFEPITTASGLAPEPSTIMVTIKKGGKPPTAAELAARQKGNYSADTTYRGGSVAAGIVASAASAAFAAPSLAMNTYRNELAFLLSRCADVHRGEHMVTFAESPIPLSIGSTPYSYYIGAVVMNFVLVVVALLAHLGYCIGRYLLSSFFGTCSMAAVFSAGCFPSYSIYAFFFLPPNIYFGVVLLLHSGNHLDIQLFALFMTLIWVPTILGTGAVCLSPSRWASYEPLDDLLREPSDPEDTQDSDADGDSPLPSATQSPGTGAKTVESRSAFERWCCERGLWEPRNNSQSRAFRMTSAFYVFFNINARWWFFEEVLVATFTSITLAIAYGSSVTCYAGAAVVTLFLFIHWLLLLIYKPYLRKLTNVLVIFLTTLQLISTGLSIGALVLTHDDPLSEDAAIFRQVVDALTIACNVLLCIIALFELLMLVLAKFTNVTVSAKQLADSVVFSRSVSRVAGGGDGGADASFSPSPRQANGRHKYLASDDEEYGSPIEMDSAQRLAGMDGTNSAPLLRHDFLGDHLGSRENSNAAGVGSGGDSVSPSNPLHKHSLYKLQKDQRTSGKRGGRVGLLGPNADEGEVDVPTQMMQENRSGWQPEHSNTYNPYGNSKGAGAVVATKGWPGKVPVYYDPSAPDPFDDLPPGSSGEEDDQENSENENPDQSKKTKKGSDSAQPQERKSLLVQSNEQSAGHTERVKKLLGAAARPDDDDGEDEDDTPGDIFARRVKSRRLRQLGNVTEGRPVSRRKKKRVLFN